MIEERVENQPQKKLSNILQLPTKDKLIGSFLALTNLICIIFGILGFSGWNPTEISNLFGISIFLTFLLNSLINHVVYVYKIYENINYEEYLEISIIYDIITFFSALFLGYGNLQQSFAFYVQAEFTGQFGLFLRILGYFVPFLFELYIIRRSVFKRVHFLPQSLVKEVLGEKNAEKITSPQLEPTRLKKYLKKKSLRKAINILIKALCIISFIVFILFTYIMYSVAPHPISMTMVLELSQGIMGIVIAPFALFFGMAVFTNGILALKLNHRYRKRRDYSIIARHGFVLVAVGSLIMSLLFFNSIFQGPFTLDNARSEFQGKFGDQWENFVQREGFERDSSYFMDKPIMLSEYFLPTFTENCRIKQDIPFYNDTIGVDNNITLFYDVYMPGNGWERMPGKNSTIIRIHGGAWMLGDKGIGNMLQTSKYLASQGYVVFDIQYGLYNASLNENIADIFQNMPQDETRIGNFSLNDMIRHIGIFTEHLENNWQKYGANLSSVFISGGSAGGNLCCAATLAMVNAEYQALFSDELKIKGYIPIYPANDICRIEGVNSSEDFIDPKDMITGTSPPCLILQGTNDGLVNPNLAEEFQQVYEEKNNSQCAVVYLKLAAHGFDVYYSGYYNQISLYYMERFLYLYR